MKFTEKNVQNFLQVQLKSEVAQIVTANGGDWSQAFFFEFGGQGKIIRFSQTDEDFRKDQFAHQFCSPRLPIPEIEEIGTAFDGYYAISPKITGKMIDHLSPVEMQQFFPQIFDLLDALRSVDISKTVGFGGFNAQGRGSKNSWREFLSGVNEFDPASRVDWRVNLTSRPDTYSVFQSVYQEMVKLLEFCPEERYLVHNDLLHFNVLVDENKVAGVIDWGCSLYGDFLYDLAMFDLWQFYYPSMRGINFKAAAKKFFGQKGISLPHYDQRLKCYQCHLALDAIKYCAYKDNEKDLRLITDRIKEIIV